MNEIVKHDEIFSLERYKNMCDFAQGLIKSGFLPDSIKTQEQAVAIILTGQELGLPTMYSLRNINVIKGKPTMSAEMQLAIFIRRGGLAQWIESTNERATLKLKHPYSDTWHTETFTFADAERAKLTKYWDDNKKEWKPNQNYLKFPKNLLRARCTTNALRAVAPDIQMGLYDPEEMRAVVNSELAEKDLIDINVPEVIEGEEIYDTTPPVPEPESVDRQDNNEGSIYYLLKEFQAIKKEYKNQFGNDKLYYDTLSKRGYKKSSEIPLENRGNALKVLRGVLRKEWKSPQPPESPTFNEDGEPGNQAPSPAKTAQDGIDGEIEAKISEKQIIELDAAAEKRGIVKELHEHIEEDYFCNIDDLTAHDADVVFAWVMSQPEKKTQLL